MCSFVVSIVSADGLALLGARASAATMIFKFGPCVYDTWRVKRGSLMISQHWYHQATSHYWRQWWPRSTMPYVINRLVTQLTLNTLRPRQNGRHFPDDIFKCISLNENIWILIEISLNFVPRGPINIIPALVQIMAWRRPGVKPLSEPMMVCLLTHICVTRPQWGKQLHNLFSKYNFISMYCRFLYI